MTPRSCLWSPREKLPSACASEEGRELPPRVQESRKQRPPLCCPGQQGPKYGRLSATHCLLLASILRGGLGQPARSPRAVRRHRLLQPTLSGGISLGSRPGGFLAAAWWRSCPSGGPRPLWPHYWAVSLEGVTHPSPCQWFPSQTGTRPGPGQPKRAGGRKGGNGRAGRRGREWPWRQREAGGSLGCWPSPGGHATLAPRGTGAGVLRVFRPPGQASSGC